METVFIHGWAAYSFAWANNLAKGDRVITLPGHGKNPNDSWYSHSLDEAVDKILKTISSDTIAVGWSLGGQVLIEAATKEPSKFKGLVLVGVSPRFTKSDDFPHAQSRALVKRMIQDLNTAPEETLQRFYKLNFTEKEMETEEAKEFISAHENAVKDMDFPSLVNSLETLLDIDLRDKLNKIKCPVLIIQGDKDNVCPVDVSAYLHQNIKNSELKIYKNYGHAPFLTMHDEFNKDVAMFIHKIKMEDTVISTDNIFDKSLVKKSFSEAVGSYDEYADMQKEVAENLVQKYSSDIKNSDGAILDIGCGTGKVIEETHKLNNNADIIGIDISIEMALEAAKKTGAECIEGDFESMPFPDEEFAICLSSLTYQWATPGTNPFRDAFRVLKEGGAFIFSTLTEGTQHELKDSIAASSKNQIHPMTIEFKDTKEIESLLKDAGFKDIEFTKETIIKNYNSPWEVFRTLKMIGATSPYRKIYGDEGLFKGLFLKDVSAYYDKHFRNSEGIPCTYEVVYVKAVK